ncbi:unnamed protein product, partial [Dovyalis caffra]
MKKVDDKEFERGRKGERQERVRGKGGEGKVEGREGARGRERKSERGIEWLLIAIENKFPGVQVQE